MNKLTRHSSEDLKARRQQGPSQSDWDNLHRNLAAGVEPLCDDDAPDASAALTELLNKTRPGRVLGSGSKQLQTVRLDVAIIAAFKSTGKGWQTRMNDALRTYLEEHPIKKSA